MTWHVEIEGLTDGERDAARLAVMLSDLRPWWPLLVPMFVGWMREQFDTEGAFGGASWAPLSPNYAAYKAQRYPGKGILIAEGDLRRSASNPTREMRPLSLTLIIDSEVAGFHQEGTDSMPARPLLWGETEPVSVALELAQFADRVADEILQRSGWRL